MYIFFVNQTLLLYDIYMHYCGKTHKLTDYFGGYNSAQCFRYVKNKCGSCLYRRLYRNSPNISSSPPSCRELVAGRVLFICHHVDSIFCVRAPVSGSTSTTGLSLYLLGFNCRHLYTIFVPLTHLRLYINLLLLHTLLLNMQFNLTTLFKILCICAR